MARQAGPFKIVGSMGSFSFYIDKNGNEIVRKKGGPRKQQIKKSKKFAAFRGNGQEFGGASALASKIRSVFGEYTPSVREGSHVNRLTTLLRTIAQKDALLEKGARHAFNADIAPLEGFQWNSKLSLEDAIDAPVAAFINPEDGEMHVIISSFQPSVQMNRPGHATHFKLVVSGVGFKRFEPSVHGGRTTWESPVLKIDKKDTGSFTVNLKTPEGYQVFILGMGVLFYEQVNQELLPVHGGAFDILKTAKKAEQEWVWRIEPLPWEQKKKTE